VVAYGLGVNSTAMLVEFANRGIKPDMILFADTGGEKPETYRYMPIMQAYLKTVQFPPVVTVRYEPKTAPYRTLEGQCLHTGTLPSLAYGGKTCSLKFKRGPADAHVLRHFPPAKLFERGQRVVRAIGFDASEGRRTFAGVVKAIGLDAGERHRLTWAEPRPGGPVRKPSREAKLDAEYFTYWYPLATDWGMDRAACERSIRAAGLPVPVKSACFYCPASKKKEIVWLREHHPDLLERALAIEANARPNLTSVVGLGRSFAWADFLADLDDLPLFDCGG
jgi:hypothetical protein